MDYTQLNAADIAELIAKREVSPVEIIKKHLERIDKINPKINAFITVLHDDAMNQAKRAEEKLVKGETIGPLHGVPMAFKDLTPVNGVRTTFGSPIFKDFVPVHEPSIVKRIRASGAIIVGKTNTPEFGHKGTTDNPLIGATKNPWNLSLTAGGSSGGSGAAVASGCVPLAEGSDGGGSIRIPASFNGIVGFKPTYGLVPNDSNPTNRFGSTQPFVHYGPLARTVKDAALMFSVMQGHEPDDPFSMPGLNEDIMSLVEEDIKGLRIAYTPDFGLYEVDSEVKQVMDRAVQNFRHMGATVEEVSIDYGMTLKEMVSFFNKMWFAGLAAGFAEKFQQSPERFSTTVGEMIEEGMRISGVELRQTEVLRTRIWTQTRSILTTHQLLLSPTLAVPAFHYEKIGPNTINGKKIAQISDWMMTQIFNITGQPAISIPAGLSSTNLPIGMQLAGNRFSDSMVLKAANAYEKNFGPFERPAI
ncbi:amidase [Pseudalkalibacillus caeni]|uniref:amidase n=1 Tax=Exobacillus caeni TaxID=2574798 RepID=UPI001485781E|nr:amidase [Pseudalkalibacillus caeni]